MSDNMNHLNARTTPATHADLASAEPSMHGASRRAVIAGLAVGVPAIVATSTSPAMAVSNDWSVVFNDSSYSARGASTLSGLSVLVSKNGAPQAGQNVYLTLADGYTFVDGSTTAVGTTGTSGTVSVPTIKVPANAPVSTIVASSNSVTATASIQGSGLKSVQFDKTGYSANGGSRITGVVASVYSDGSPLSGVNVYMTLKDGWTFADGSSVFVATSGGTGSVAAPDIIVPSSGATSSISASAASRTATADVRKSGLVTIDFSEAAYSARGGSSISGVFATLLSDGSPVSSTNVYFSLADGYTFAGGSSSTVGTSSTAGVVLLPAVIVPAGAGPSTIKAAGASASASASVRSSGLVNVALDRNVYSPAAGSSVITGAFVTVSDDGAGVSGANVYVNLPNGYNFSDGSQLFVGTTGPTGVAYLPDITANAGASSGILVASANSTSGTATLRPSGVTSLQMSAPAYSAMTGTSTIAGAFVRLTADGNPVSGTNVYVNLSNGYTFAGAGATWVGTTDNSGIAYMPDISVGGTGAGVVVAHALSLTTYATVQPSGLTVVDFSQPRYSASGGGGSISGVIARVRQDGKAVSGTSVYVNLQDGYTFADGSKLWIGSSGSEGTVSVPAISVPANGALSQITASSNSASATASLQKSGLTTLAFDRFAYSSGGGGTISGVTVTLARDGAGVSGTNVYASVPYGFAFPGGSQSTVITAGASGVVVLPDITVASNASSRLITVSALSLTAQAELSR